MASHASKLLFGTIKYDFFSSIVVFLIAIPLCLGIALACGVPLFSGVITGVIGGIVVGLISESQLSVSGPAAGMIAVIVTTISELGGFEGFLFALLLAGILQIGAGLCRIGFVANYVPTNVIQGLLAAIGILIILKQLPLAFGFIADSHQYVDELKDAVGTFSFDGLRSVFAHADLGATLITIISLLTLIFWQKVFPAAEKVLPAAVIVVIVSVVMSEIFKFALPSLALESGHLVNIPLINSWGDFTAQLRHPDFSRLYDIHIYQCAGVIAIVASLETLLNLEGVEKLDKRRRYCSRNRELVAQGIGNVCSSLVGGLPVTSVVVRSSVNINAGARSKMSAIFHGAWLLLSITFIEKFINYIPIAALAAILIHTGYKLANFTLFKNAYAEGMRYFLPFIITVLAIVFTDLLTGIVIGLSVSFFFILQHHSANVFTRIEENHVSGRVLRLLLPSQLTFLNKASVVSELNALPDASRVVIDAHLTDYMDNDILSVLKQFSETQASNKNILVNLEGFKDVYRIENQTNFITVTTPDVQAQLSPTMVLQILSEGNARFMTHKPIHKNYHQQIMATAHAQHPMAVILSCIDSRVPVEVIFDLNLGDVFVARVAGSVVNEDVLGSIEYACEVAGAKLIVILGHGGCGAIKAACDDVKLGHLTQLLQKIKPAIALETQTTLQRDSQNGEFVRNVTKKHTQLIQQTLTQNSPILQNLVTKDSVRIVSAYYNLTSGLVEFSADDNILLPTTSASGHGGPKQAFKRIMDYFSRFNNT